MLYVPYRAITFKISGEKSKLAHINFKLTNQVINQYN